MPELPEVETVRQGLLPYIEGCQVNQVIIRDARLRWPIPKELPKLLYHQTINQLQRRGKYLLFITKKGTMLAHLGMSGRLRLLKTAMPAGKHDHVDFLLSQGYCLRFTDPRRFGCILWTENPKKHALLVNLGVEPLEAQFNGRYLYKKAQGRRTPIKSFIMNSQIVVGVGNIYANEALFFAGIHPQRAASTLTAQDCNKLSQAIKKVLKRSIKLGGTSLKDFWNADGQPGYFKQSLQVYGQGGKPCKQCKIPLQEIRLGQRSTVFCLQCQT